MPVLRILTVIALVACLVVFNLWLFRRMSLKAAFMMITLFLQAVQTTKIMYIAFAFPASQNYLIVLNGIISMAIMIMLAVCYYRAASIVVGCANIVTLFVAAVVVNTMTLTQSVILLTLFSLCFIALGDMMFRNVKHLQSENKQYHSEEQRLLSTLRLNRKEIRAYVEMCRNDNPSDGDTDRLFDMLSEKSQRNVINAVVRKKALDASRTEDLKDQMPDFTPMELEVAQLILRDMKLSQIVDYTGKSESNISVVRSRIRKKLGLAPGDDLRQALMDKLGMQEEEG